MSQQKLEVVMIRQIVTPRQPRKIVLVTDRLFIFDNQREELYMKHISTST
jgi:hypothetical protein